LKANKLEEILVDLANEMVDNHHEYGQIVKKHSESEIKMMGRRETMQNLIFKIFKEIGREKTMAYIKQDFKEGRRASVRVVD
jgi:hypothetical protein